MALSPSLSNITLATTRCVQLSRASNVVGLPFRVENFGESTHRLPHLLPLFDTEFFCSLHLENMNPSLTSLKTKFSIVLFSIPALPSPQQQPLHRQPAALKSWSRFFGNTKSLPIKNNAFFTLFFFYYICLSTSVLLCSWFFNKKLLSRDREISFSM